MTMKAGEVNEGDDVSEFWVVGDQFAFENIGFSRPGAGNIKVRACMLWLVGVWMWSTQQDTCLRQ